MRRGLLYVLLLVSLGSAFYLFRSTKAERTAKSEPEKRVENFDSELVPTSPIPKRKRTTAQLDPDQLDKLFPTPKPSPEATTEPDEVTLHPRNIVIPSLPPVRSGQTQADEAAVLSEEHQPLFTRDELAQLQGNSDRNTNRNMGGGGGSSLVVPRAVREIESDDEPEPEESPIPIESPLPFVEGQARGYTMLYLMHPRARFGVEKQIEILLDSRLRNLYLGVLVDGTFGEDFPYLADVVRRLNTSERRLTLVLYLSNGATMRSFDRTTMDGGFNKIDPKEFRNLIRFNPSTRAQFSEIARKAQPAFALNTELNPESQNIAIVMLEDNLERESYRAMRDLARSVLGDSVAYVRNPCNCYDDKSDNDPVGGPLEIHTTQDLAIMRSVEGFSLDGVGFSLPFENGVQGIDMDGVEDLMSLSVARGVRYFGLWRFDRQGTSRAGEIHPDQRDFAVATNEQKRFEIELLRFGLRP